MAKLKRRFAGFVSSMAGSWAADDPRGRAASLPAWALVLAGLLLANPAWAIIDVNKSFTPINILPGQASVVEITLFNSSQTFSVTNAALIDVLPAGVVISGALIQNTCGGSVVLTPDTQIDVSGATIPVGVGGNSGTCVIRVPVTSATPGTYVNQIAIGDVCGTENGATICNPEDAEATLIVNPVLPLTGTKSNLNGANHLHVGGTDRITVRINNPNAIVVTNVSFVDNLPTPLIVANPANIGGTCSGTVTALPAAASFSLAGASIAAGGFCTVQVDVTVNPAQSATARNGNVTNTIPVGGVTSAEGPVNAAAISDTIPVQTGAQIVKSFSPSPIQIGALSTLTLSLRNYNTTPITGASLVDTMPAGITVVGPASTTCADGVAAFTATEVSVTGATIPAAANAVGSNFGVCTLSVVVSGDAAGSLVNSIPAGNLNGINYQATSGTLTVVNSVSLSKAFSPATRPQGTATVLTVTFANGSGVPATITSFSDNLGSMGGTLGTITGTSTTCAGGAPSFVGLVVSMNSGTIPAAGSCTLTINIQLASDATTGNRTNTIPANTLVTSIGSYALPATAVLNVLRTATLDKLYTPATIAGGGISRLTIRVTRAAGAPAFTDVDFSDNLPAGHTVAVVPNVFNSCGGTVTAVPLAASVSVANGSLAFGSVCELQLDIQAPAGTGASTNTIENNGGVGDDEFAVSDGTNSYRDGRDRSATLTRTAPNLLLNKAFVPVTINGGGFSVAQVLISNNQPGSIALSGVALTDNLPPNVQVYATPAASFTGAGCIGGTITAVPGAGSFSLTSASIAANSVCTLSVRVTSTFDGNHINEIAAGELSSREGVSNGNTVSATLTVQRNVNVQKWFSPTAIPTGGTSTLTIRIYNTNDAVRTFTPAGVVDNLPVGVTIAAAPAATTDCPGATLSAPPAGSTITVGNFPLGSNTFCDVVVPVTVNTAGSYVNTIAASTLVTVEGSTNPDPATATLIAVDPPTIAKAFAPASIALGASSTITFTLVNASSVAPLTGASFSDTLPANMQIFANAAAGGTCVGAGSNFFVGGTSGSLSFTGLTVPFGGTLAARTCTVTVVVTTTTVGSFDNQATGFTSNETPTPVSSNIATLTVLADRPSISKSFAPDPIPLGSSSTLTFTLSNPNAVAVSLPNDAFEDIFPAGMTVASPLATTNTCGGTLRDSGNGALAPGDVGIELDGQTGGSATIPAAGSCTLSVDVTTLSAGVYNNTSTVLTSSNAGSSLLPATDTLTVNPPVLTTTKSVSPNPVVLGGTATYTVTVSNSNAPGTGRASAGMIITDPLPFDITLVDTVGSDAGWSCIGSSSLVCTYANTLAAGASTTLLLNVQVGEAAINGDNTARVQGGGDPLCPTPPVDAAARCSGQVIVSTVPVMLSRVASRVSGGELLVDFSTVTEMGVLGFRVHAGIGADPALRAPLDSRLTRARAAAFARADYSVRGGFHGQTQVWVEELTTRGKSIFYGPFPVASEIGSNDAPVAIDWARVRAEQVAFRLQQAQALRQRSGSALEAEIGVAQSGWVVIRHEDLLAAGIDWSGVDRERLALTRDGSPVALWHDSHGPFGTGSRIAFLGHPVDASLYTRTAVYRLALAANAQPRIPVVYAAPGASALSLSSRERIVHAPNRLYAPYSATSDPWYAGEVYRDGAASTPLQESFSVPQKLSTTNPERLRVVLWGGIVAPQAPDHSLRILLNGQPVATTTFDGLSQVVIETDLQPGLLNSGANSLSVELLADTGVEYDLVMLESIEVEYDRALVAVDDRFQFEIGEDVIDSAAQDRIYASEFEDQPAGACAAAGDCARYRISGLDSAAVRVLRERAGRVEELVGFRVSDSAPFDVEFASTRAPGDRYWIEPAAGGVDASLAPSAPVTDPLDGPPANYLVIAHPSFVPALAPLVAAREAEGFGVRVVDVEDLYRRYTGGVFDPQAIKRAIADAHARLGTRYVLLVGGDSYDYFNYSGAGSVSFIPTFYRPTDPSVIRFGPADVVHADVDDDGLPDVALGRLPVRDLAELDRVVAKTLAYAQADHARRYALVSDRPDPLVFSTQLDQVGQSLTGWTRTRLDLGSYPPGSAGTTAARGDLVTAVDAGQSLLAYMGHSGPDRWTFSGLLSAQQVAGGLFSNSTRPTVVWNLGCYGSFFTQPAVNTIAHGFMLGTGGAAAVIGASGLTEISSDIAWINTMMLYLPGDRIGDALMRSQRLLGTIGPQYQDIAVGGNLLGDPALRLRQ